MSLYLFRKFDLKSLISGSNLYQCHVPLYQTHPLLDSLLHHILIFKSLDYLWLNHPLDLVPVTLEYLYLLELLLIWLPPLSYLLPLDWHLSEVLLSGILDSVVGRWSCKLDVPRDEVFGSVETNIWAFEAVLFMVENGFVQAVHEMRLPRVGLLAILDDLFYWQLIVILKIQRDSFFRWILIQTLPLNLIVISYANSCYILLW